MGKLTLEETRKLVRERSLSGANKIPKIQIVRKKQRELKEKIEKEKEKDLKKKKVLRNKNTSTKPIKRVYDPNEGKEIKEDILTNDYDVKKDVKIEFFDPEKSYELTGYRPIGMFTGLDFDIKPFIRARTLKQNTGNYTTFPKGSIQYRNFWDRERELCIKGLKIGRYRITGDHYFFLNYYRLLDTSNVSKAGGGRTDSFPAFIAEQYKWFHYVEMSELLGFDCAALKPRGVGWSEIAASLGVRTYTTIKASLCRYAATTDVFIEDTIKKCWAQLDFLNSETEGGFKHLRLVKDTMFKKKASLKDIYGTESGFLSSIEGINIDQSRKLRGGRVERLLFEESGSNANLVTTYNQSQALIEIGGIRIGTRFVWGTGGDKGPQLEGLSKMFYNPKSFNILPYRHNNNMKHEYVYTAFFIPAYDICFKYCDNRGVCNRAEAIAFYKREWAKKENMPKNLMEYKSEFCFYPEDALSREGDNLFESERIIEQVSNIELHHTIAPPTIGSIAFPLTDLGEVDFTKEPSFAKDLKGHVKIYEFPKKTVNNEFYKNLYVAGIDSIDADASTSSGQSDVSDFCIVIKKRMLGLDVPMYVATYKFRPKDIRSAYNTAIGLMKMYNCKGLVEATRVSIITYIKDKKLSNLLIKRPISTMPLKAHYNVKFPPFGAPSDSKTIQHGLDLLKDYINDYCYNIPSLDILNELMHYSYENKRKFDYVAAMQMAELADEDLNGVVAKAEEIYDENVEIETIGYFTDKKGVTRYGAHYE